MDANVKTQWVEALTSGDYQQGQGKLAYVDSQNKTRYCCLGVLCDLAVKAGVIDEPEYDDDQHAAFYDGEGAILPVRVYEWAGLANIHGDPTEDKSYYLPSKNDQGATFTEIAKIIQENF